MKRKIMSTLLAACLIITLLPAVAFADDAQNSEFVAVDKQCIKSIAEDGRTIILKSRAPKPDPGKILTVENTYQFYLAERITEGSSVKYVIIEDTEKIKCVEEGLSFGSRPETIMQNNFNMYGEGNDEFRTYTSHLAAEEVGVYTLEYNGQQVQIEVKLPEYYYYSQPEATIKNQRGVLRYDPKKENVLYMIITEPKKFRSPEFYIENEEMAAAATLEQMGEYGEICKVTVNKPIDYISVRFRFFNNGNIDNTGNRFYIVEKPEKVILKGLKTSTKHRITVKWEEQDAYGYHVKIATNSKFTKNVKNYYVKDATSKTIKNLKKGKKYYVKVRAYNAADGKYYGSWSKYKSITCK